MRASLNAFELVYGISGGVAMYDSLAPGFARIMHSVGNSISDVACAKLWTLAGHGTVHGVAQYVAHKVALVPGRRPCRTAHG